MNSLRDRYVVKAVKRSKRGNLWLNLGPREQLTDILQYLGTDSPTEIAQIVKGLLSDLAKNNIKIVVVQKSK